MCRRHIHGTLQTTDRHCQRGVTYSQTHRPQRASVFTAHANRLALMESAWSTSCKTFQRIRRKKCVPKKLFAVSVSRTDPLTVIASEAGALPLLYPGICFGAAKNTQPRPTGSRDTARHRAQPAGHRKHCTGRIRILTQIKRMQKKWF